ncbi:MAG TPA: diacylglycerol kinase family protein [Gaiella sp.]|uniref:diacylglycerol/lipid kinase family protein n=1 Tax=Gaiella sp. TaxID=2663207 RepID=UPI002D7E490B|nr:diacylglycerol kinase family protein [Gaiella sp.]HET9288495.1 diacylglycerol kinase family protein [Gaiella sp.]
MGALLIVNPQASGVSEELVARVVGELPDDLEVVRTGGPGEATTIAREREPSVEAIYVLSGDGTYNEVLNGVAGTIPLGFLPGGGTSVLPRALGLGRDPVVAARVAARGATRRIGLGRVNGRRFSFNAGIGFDAELVRRIDAKGRRADGRRPGDLAFVRTAIGLVTARRGSFPDALEIEGAGRAAFALVANCDPYTYAGRVPVRVASGASFDLGLDLVAPTSLRARNLPRLLLEMSRGARPRPGLTVLHDVERIVIRCDAPMPLQVDGEDLGDVEHAAFETEPHAVTALVPGR